MKIKCNHLDVQRLAKGLAEREAALLRELSMVRYKKSVVSKVLRQNEERGRKWIVGLPVDALPERVKERAGNNWKQMVLDVFERYQCPMTSELMANKLMLHFPEVSFDRRHVVMNVSAALRYLQQKKKVIERARLAGNKEYVYGLADHFDEAGSLRREAYLSLMYESGVIEKLVSPRVRIVEVEEVLS